MNTKNVFGIITLFIIMLAVACESSLPGDNENDKSILPTSFGIDIPDALSNNLKSASLKSTQADTINDNLIYWWLNGYIAVGEGAADIVNHIIRTIRIYHIEDVVSLTYTSNDDNRLKNLDVSANVEFEGRLWEYRLTITDAASEINEDGGFGMQVFWNKQPIEGIAIFKPYNLDRSENEHAPDAMGRIVYSEKDSAGYEAFMLVEIADLPAPDEFSRPFAVENMKMFIGKKGNLVDVIGNSSHPEAQFNRYDNNAVGYNWAFVASANKDEDIAVAEVGLPLNALDISTRQSILEDNSIKKVLTREMTNYLVAAYAEAGITLQPNEVANYLSPYLKNADAPGYFNHRGFVCGGTAPDSRYSALSERILSLTPYNPAQIANLTIEFGN